MAVQSGAPGRVRVSDGPESVGLGAAAVGVLVGACVVLAAALSPYGLAPALAALVLSAGAPRVYASAAGAPARAGLGALLGLVVAGLVFVVATPMFIEMWQVYDAYDVAGQGWLRSQFVQRAFMSPQVWWERAPLVVAVAVAGLAGAWGESRR